MDLLEEVEKNLAELEAEFEKQSKDLEDTKNKIRDCELKLDRAGRLNKGLSSEKVRWKQSVIDLTEEIKCILSDIILACGCISYLGPFNSKYRNKIIKDIWIPA